VRVHSARTLPQFPAALPAPAAEPGPAPRTE